MRVTETGGFESSGRQVGAATYIVMMSGLASQSLLFTLPSPLLPSLARDLGSSGPFIAQMVFAVASLGLTVTSFASGMAVRAVGVRGLLILSAMLYGLAGIVPALTSDATALLVSRLLVGGACGLLTTGCTMLLAHCYYGTARARALGYQTTLGSMAGLAALLISGATVAATGWHMPFLLYGMFALLVVILSIIGVAPVPLPFHAAQTGLSEALARIWPVLLAACLLMMVPLLVASETPFILTLAGVTDPVTHAVVISMATLFCAVSGALFGPVQRRLGVRQTFATALLLAAAGLMCIGAAWNGWVASLGCILEGTGLGLFIPHLWVLATTLAPERVRGHAIGLLTSAMFLGGFLYPFLFGVIQRLFGLDRGMMAVAGLLAVGAIAVSIARHARLAGTAAT